VYTLTQGNALVELQKLPSNSVHCVITSPPYYGLRNYNTPPQTWGEWSGHLGMEPTPDLFVEHLVEVFREVKRVLTADGTLWVVIGDTYHGSWGNYGNRPELDGKTLNQREKNCEAYSRRGTADHRERPPSSFKIDGLKPKDLMGVPWKLAFALRDDGWWLRQDIIWAKTSCMPESVRDRCTRSHEYVFLFSKSSQYYYDWFAIREPVADVSMERVKYGWDCDRPSTKNNAFQTGDGLHFEVMGDRWTNSAGRNKRDVWFVGPKPFKGAHFATFPVELIRPMIKAGCPEKVCSTCGKSWERRVEMRRPPADVYTKSKRPLEICAFSIKGAPDRACGQKYQDWINANPPDDRLEPTCDCNAETKCGTVLDPFNGSATTGVVAMQEKRDYIGIELNPEYVVMSKNRLEKEEQRLSHLPKQNLLFGETDG